MKIYVDREGRKFNPAAAITHEGVTYSGNVLDFPQVLEALGIDQIEVEDTPPEEYLLHPDYYIRSEPDFHPYVVYTRREDEAIAETHKGNVIKQIRAIEDAVENDMRKLTRIFMLDMMVHMAAQAGMTEPELYGKNKGYRGLKDLEARIAPLRSQI